MTATRDRRGGRIRVPQRAACGRAACALLAALPAASPAAVAASGRPAVQPAKAPSKHCKGGSLRRVIHVFSQAAVCGGRTRGWAPVFPGQRVDAMCFNPKRGRLGARKQVPPPLPLPATPHACAGSSTARGLEGSGGRSTKRSTQALHEPPAACPPRRLLTEPNSRAPLQLSDISKQPHDPLALRP